MAFRFGSSASARLASARFGFARECSASQFVAGSLSRCAIGLWHQVEGRRERGRLARQHDGEHATCAGNIAYGNLP